MFRLALMFGLHLGQEHRGGDSWFAADKAKHLFVAAFVQSASYSALRSVGLGNSGSLFGASAVGIGVSVGKELSDKRHGQEVSAKDLTWDAIGLAGASVLLNRTKR